MAKNNYAFSPVRLESPRGEEVSLDSPRLVELETPVDTPRQIFPDQELDPSRPRSR